MMKRRLALLSAVAVAAALAVGGSTASARTDDARASADTQLSALFVTTHQPAWLVLIKNFNNVVTDITINPVTYLPSGTVRSLILTELQAGNAPDMFFANSGRASPSAVKPLAESGKLLPLTGPWTKRLTPDVKSDMSIGGKVYGLPVSLFVQGIAYNKSVFSQLSLKPPTTFGQLLSTCGKIKAAGKIPFAQGFSELNGFSNWQATLSILPYLAQPTWNTLREQHKVTFQTSPAWRRGLQMLVDMKNASCFSPGVQGTTVAASLVQLVKGDAAMSVLASVQTGALRAVDPTFTPGWIPFPYDSAKQTRMIVNDSSVAVVNAATTHPKEAQAFLNFIGRPKQQSLFAKISGGTSDYDIKSCNLDPTLLANFIPLCKSKLVVSAKTGSWPNPNMGLGYLNGALQGLLLGSKSVDDVLKGLDYMWDNPTATSPPT